VELPSGWTHFAPTEVQTSIQEAPFFAPSACEIDGASAAIKMASTAIQDVRARDARRNRMGSILSSQSMTSRPSEQAGEGPAMATRVDPSQESTWAS